MPSSQAAEVGALFDRYLITLDEEKLDDDWARGLFTEDARIVFPMSQHEGIEGLAAYHGQALSRYERTQHLNSPAVVEVRGSRASFRANLMSTHVHLAANAPAGGERPALFATGTSVTGAARRTPDGWRLSELSFRVVWMTGSPPPRPSG